MDSISKENLDHLAGLFLVEQTTAVAETALHQGLISEEQFSKAVNQARDQGHSVADVLVSQGLLSPQKIRELNSTIALDEMKSLWGTQSYGPPPEVVPWLSDPTRRIAEFVLVNSLGQGGAGEVWKAWDLNLHRWVALKIPNAILDSNEKRERFRQEAFAPARLNHPGIIPIFRVAEERKRPYIVMQLIEGKTLEELRLPLDQSLEVIAKVAEAVQFAHEHGIIHRDIKPGNILMDSQGVPRIFDFGLAYIAEEHQSLTATGTVFGTPGYMSPEQVSGDHSMRSAATDIYGLGASLYDLLCGRPPHVGSSPGEILRRVLDEDPPRPRILNPAIPKEIETIVLKAIDREPTRRYASAKEFAEDIAHYQKGEAIQASPPSVLYLLRRRAQRHRGLVFSVLISAIVISIVTGVFVPQWLYERREKERRETQLREQEDTNRKNREALAAQARENELALQELSVLWTNLVLEKQDFYVQDRDPSETRKRILRLITRLDTFIRSHPNLPRAYFVRAWAHYYIRNFILAAQDVSFFLQAEPSNSMAWALFGRIKIAVVKGSLFYSWSTPETREAAAKEIRECFSHVRSRATEKSTNAPGDAMILREEEVSENVSRALEQFFLDPDGQEKAQKFLQESHAAYASEEYLHYLGLWAPHVDLKIDHFSRAIRIKPHFAEALFDRGCMSLLKHDREAAIRDFSQAVRIDPHFADAYYNRGVALGLQSRNAEALKDYEEAIRLNPAYYAAWLNLAECKRLSRDFQGALQAIDRAVEGFPQSCEILCRRAFLYELFADEPASDRKSCLLKARQDYQEALKKYAPPARPQKDIEDWLKRVEYKLSQLPQ